MIPVFKLFLLAVFVSFARSPSEPEGSSNCSSFFWRRLQPFKRVCLEPTLPDKEEPFSVLNRIRFSSHFSNFELFVTFFFHFGILLIVFFFSVAPVPVVTVPRIPPVQMPEMHNPFTAFTAEYAALHSPRSQVQMSPSHTSPQKTRPQASTLGPTCFCIL